MSRGLFAIALLAAGCTGPSGGPLAVTASTLQTRASPTAALPNPFSIMARYPAASLGLQHPVDLAIGPNGDVYVTDRSQQVALISPSGTVLRTWGSEGSGPGQFDFISTDPTDPLDVHASVAVGPDGEVYVADSGNNRVEVFTPTGGFIRQFGRPGEGPGRFLDVFDLAVDQGGNVYVADDGAETLSKVSVTDRFEWSVGGPTNPDDDLLGHFHSPQIDPHGHVVAGVDNAHTVVYLDDNGHKFEAFNVARYFRNASGPCNVSVDQVGDTVVQSCPTGPRTNPHGDTLVFDRRHQPIGAWYGSPFATDATPRFGPRGEVFALGADGTILRLKLALSGA